jgi:hypothetical protein
MSIKSDIIDLIKTRLEALGLEAVNFPAFGGEGQGTPTTGVVIDVLIGDTSPAGDEYQDGAPVGRERYVFGVGIIARFGAAWAAGRLPHKAADDLGNSIYTNVVAPGDGSFGGLAVRSAWAGGGAAGVDGGGMACAFGFDVEYRHKSGDPTAI